ncbi:unnamed protein product [Porites lobata]|uniref:G-protein coupled receptors family 1 profile domain-containing protein n=1 Tax=Porites lobata TaxID=104759 RepID=A0ABN8S1J8_9CNID|nr:unnamed protein product [Porites lobata]
METWFWILGWFLSFLTIIGNGFTIFLVCNRRNLRTKTNAFIVSLAVADFCVGLSVIPSLFFCDITNTCHWPDYWFSWVNIIRLLLSYTSALNLCGLVLDRFIAIVYLLKYITLMTRKSALIMMGIVIRVFLVCYGMYLRCGFQILSSSRCNDENYKIPFLVLNSAINPLAYAFFKRDIKKEFKRLVGSVF